MVERLTLATATGLPFVGLVVHVATGVVALAAGFSGLMARKGGPVHRRSGRIFVIAMLATGITASAISAYEGKSAGSGMLIAYFVLTAYTAVRPLAEITRRAQMGLMTLALVMAATTYASGMTALARPGNQLEGVPAGMLFFMASVVLLAAVGDARTIWWGGLQGTRRVARHLWRMCFVLFIASGSFFIGQMRVIPEPVRNVPVLVFLGLAPLLALLYWLWRVRLRNSTRAW